MSDNSDALDRAEERVRLERADPHGWANAPTWLWIALIVIVSLAHTYLLLYVVGKGTLGPQHWNLGYPPTAPDVILPFF